MDSDLFPFGFLVEQQVFSLKLRFVLTTILLGLSRNRKTTSISQTDAFSVPFRYFVVGTSARKYQEVSLKYVGTI